MGRIRFVMIYFIFIIILSEVDQILECFQKDNYNRVLIKWRVKLQWFFIRDGIIIKVIVYE